MLLSSKWILFASLLFFVTIEAHKRDQSQDDTLTSKLHEESIDSERGLEGKHRRKRNWPYFPSRRYHDQYQDDFFGAFDQHQTQMEILRKLDEILLYVRRPPPPPPPQYIYVRYPVPSQCNCNKKPANVPSVPSDGFPVRFPSMEDPNQNWGADDTEYPEEQFNRPLDFNGVERSTTNPLPASTSNSDSLNEIDHNEASCYAAVLRCCNLSDKRQQLRCTNRGCPKTVKAICNKQSVDAAIEYFSKNYAPK